MSELTPEALAVIRSRVALRDLSYREAVAVVEALKAAYPRAEISARELQDGWGLAASLGSETVAGSIDEVRKWLAESYPAREPHDDVPGRAGRPGRTER